MYDNDFVIIPDNTEKNNHFNKIKDEWRIFQAKGQEKLIFLMEKHYYLQTPG